MSNLFDAIERGDAGWVWQHVRQGTSLDAIDPESELSALAVAAEAGHAEIVRTLLGAGAKPDFGGATTPLEAAVVGGFHEVVEALIEYGADVNCRVEDGFTPLMTASATGDLSLVEMLVDAGAKIRARNDDGDTAINLAEDGGHGAVATVLRSRQRRHTVETKDDRGAARAASPPKVEVPEPVAAQAELEEVPELAAEVVTQEVAEEVSAALEPTPQQEEDPLPFTQTIPDESDEPLYEDTREERLQPLLKLLAKSPEALRRALRDHRPDPDEADAEGVTLLMAAAGLGELELVQHLLAVGANVQALDSVDGGHSALVWAIRSHSPNREEILTALVEAGADLEQRCGPQSRTPLMLAAQADVYLERSGDGRFAQTTHQLVDLGADLEAEDRRGLTVWRLIKRDALGAPTFGASRRRLHQMLRVLEYCGAQPIESHAV